VQLSGTGLNSKHWTDPQFNAFFPIRSALTVSGNVQALPPALCNECRRKWRHCFTVMSKQTLWKYPFDKFSDIVTTNSDDKESVDHDF
jgi:hypothetical protein